MSNEFGSLGLDPVLCEAVKVAFDIEHPSDIQKRVISTMLSVDNLTNNRDILVRSKTGSGKTLAFLLPILQQLLTSRGKDTNSNVQELRKMGTLVLIMVPTRELAVQTQQTLDRILAKLHGKEHWLVSGTLSGGDRRKSEKERLRKGLHIVVGTPGRLLDHLKNTEKWAIQISKTIKWIVFDEADRLLDSGFEKFMKEIMSSILRPATSDSRPKILLCSATVDGSRTEVFGHKLFNPLLITEKSKQVQNSKPSSNVIDNPNNDHDHDHGSLPSGLMEESTQLDSTLGPSQLEHFYILTPTKFRLIALLGLLRQSFSKRDSSNVNSKDSGGDPQKIVLFSICCDTVDYLTALLGDSSLNLLSKNVKLHKLHGSVEHKVRMDTFAKFSKEVDNCLLVCTDVAARGLNLTNVSCIIQYDAPCDMNDYIHRAGRTARQQEQGKSILFLMPSELDYTRALEKKVPKLKSISWEPLVELIAKNVKVKEDSSKVSPSKSEQDEDDEELEISKIAIDIRKRIFSWLEKLQGQVKSKSQLLTMAKNAFLSFVRAYATHPASEKVIFHIKKLHLGHLAATFLLEEAPTTVAANRKKVDMSSSQKRKGEEFEHYNGKRGGKLSKSSKGPFKFKKIVSEFSAGDVGASFTKPRKVNNNNGDSSAGGGGMNDK